MVQCVRVLSESFVAIFRRLVLFVCSPSDPGNSRRWCWEATLEQVWSDQFVDKSMNFVSDEGLALER